MDDIHNKDIHFAAPYEVLLYEDGDSEYVGKNENGDYILGFIVDDLPKGAKLHLYIILLAADLLPYFKREKSAYDLLLVAKGLYELEKNVANTVINCRPLPLDTAQVEYDYLQEAYYLISAPLCLPEIEAAARLSVVETDLMQNKSYNKVEKVPTEIANPNYSPTTICYFNAAA